MSPGPTTSPPIRRACHPRTDVFDHFRRSFQLLVPDLLPRERISHLELLEIANQMKILEPRNRAKTDLIEEIEGIDSARFSE